MFDFGITKPNKHTFSNRKQQATLSAAQKGPRVLAAPDCVRYPSVKFAGAESEVVRDAEAVLSEKAKKAEDNCANSCV